MNRSAYKIIIPAGKRVPILLSIPHCSTFIPSHLRNIYNEEAISKSDDTDFFVDDLYNFAAELGITTILAQYNRWVIDLNRNPDNKNLYKDGRIITSLTPTTDFFDRPIYKSPNYHPDQQEIENRIEQYYTPYHNKTFELLNELKSEFGIVLLWDAHSIRRFIPTISPEPFPDLILGSNDGSSASTDLVDSALSSLQNSNFTLTHNHPFKGGYITRNYGNPDKGIHALQLEMSKLCYMDDQEIKYDNKKAEPLRRTLKQTLLALINTLSSL